MKKLLFVALIGTFVACGEATETTETTETTEVTVDTAVLVPNTDTTVITVDTTGADTTAPAAK